MKKVFISSICILFLLTGCGTVSQNSNQSKEIVIVTSFYPLAYFTEHIVGEYGTVLNISETQSVHDASLTPRDLTAMQKANLVIVIGAQLEPWLSDMSSKIHQNRLLTISQEIQLKNNTQTKGAEHKHDNHAQLHDHGELDPHIWTDPVYAQQIVRVIVNRLSTIDKNHAEYYQKNALVLIEKLQNIDQQYKEKLQQCDHAPVLVSHNAMGYLSQRYNFDTIPIAGFSPHDIPSAQQLARVHESIEEHKIHSILIEVHENNAFANTVTKQDNLDSFVFNPLGKGLVSEQDYFDVMYQNLSVLVHALHCK